MNHDRDVSQSPRFVALRLALPYATAFVSSGCIMAVEILGGRLIARYVGSSLYTWTSLIGVVLGGIAVGNYVGGRLADRYTARPTLGVLFLIAAAVCLLVPSMNDLVGEWSALWYLTWPQRVFVHITLTFLWSATALGVIGPVVAKMALDIGRRVGRTVGGVYAWGAVGSIVGTYVSGFYLIEILPASKIIYLLAGVLALVGVLYASGRRWTSAWGAAFLAVSAIAGAPWQWPQELAADLHLIDAARAEVYFDKSSHYSQVRVAADHRREGRRVMLLDKLEHSYYDPAEPHALQYGYERVFAAVTDHVAGDHRGVRALILGGGGFTHPRYVLHRRPDSRVDVVEIDPVVTEAAMTAFGLEPDPRMKIVHLDARQYLADRIRRKDRGDLVEEYDFVFLDALFDYNVPFHLATRECLELCRELLTDDGIYIANVIDILNEGAFLGTFVNTAGSVFKHVDVYFADDVAKNFNQAERCTFVVVASDRELGLENLQDSRSIPNVRRLLLSPEQLASLAEKSGGRILTDDFAPVEQLLAPVVQRAGQDVHLRHYARGNAHLAAGRFASAEAEYRRAIQARPEFDAAHLNLGISLANQNKLTDAADAFKAAANLAPTQRAPWFNLGGLYLRAGNPDASAQAFRKAIEIDPGCAPAYVGLGKALEALKRLQEAASAYESALKVDPDDVVAQAGLARLRPRR